MQRQNSATKTTSIRRRAGGAPNNTLDAGEDANGNGTLDLFGRTARNVPAGATTPCLADFPNPLHADTLVTRC